MVTVYLELNLRTWKSTTANDVGSITKLLMIIYNKMQEEKTLRDSSTKILQLFRQYK